MSPCSSFLLAFFSTSSSIVDLNWPEITSFVVEVLICMWKILLKVIPDGSRIAGLIFNMLNSEVVILHMWKIPLSSFETTTLVSYRIPAVRSYVASWWRKGCHKHEFSPWLIELTDIVSVRHVFSFRHHENQLHVCVKPTFFYQGLVNVPFWGLVSHHFQISIGNYIPSWVMWNIGT